MLNILPPDHPRAAKRGKKKKGPAKGPEVKRAPWWVWTVTIAGAVVVLYVAASAAVFYAVKWHWTDTPGGVDPQAAAYNQLAVNVALEPTVTAADDQAAAARNEAARLQSCQREVLKRVAPRNAALVDSAITAGVDAPIITKMLFAPTLRFATGSASARAMADCANVDAVVQLAASDSQKSVFPWANDEEWAVVREALRKDKPVIDRVSADLGLPSRTIVAVAIVEQLRLYYTQRELYEKFFQPLKILGNATQFAWGVMAIKEKTAIDIELRARSKSSVFYPGPAPAKILALPAKEPEKVRFARLTDEKNHYYSYVYGATELLEFMAQWRKAGYPIDDRPEILATLFNIGFGRSHPSDHPQVGGSSITIANTPYTFGGLAFEWYYSGELQDLFPYPVTPATTTTP